MSPVILIGGAPSAWGNDEYALVRVLGSDYWILRLGIEPNRPGESGVVDPLAQHELVLVLDVGIDEIAQQPALDAVVGFRRIVGGSVGHATADQPMRIVAAAVVPLTGDGLSPRVDATHVGADRTTQSPGVARSIGVHVIEVVHPLGRDAARRPVDVWRQLE